MNSRIKQIPKTLATRDWHLKKIGIKVCDVCEKRTYSDQERKIELWFNCDGVNICGECLDKSMGY